MHQAFNLLRSLEDKWQQAVATYLPVVAAPAAQKDGEKVPSVWRFNKPVPATLPNQGWKLHVSATLQSAAHVLNTVAPLLEDEGLSFKGVSTLAELKKLNCGLFYGYSQIGKFLTIYPPDEETACRVARKLSSATRGLGAPAVPFEQRVAMSSPVYVRYGLFRSDGPSNEAAMLQGPNNRPEPDRRDRNPEWALPPAGLLAPKKSKTSGPLALKYRAYSFLSQRGKGGVYRGLDLSVSPARHCVIKEGRRFGEMDVDGRDGRNRLAREIKVLAQLSEVGIPVPRTYAHFEERGNRYLVLEWVEGGSVADLLDPSKPKLDLREALRLSKQAARLLVQIHDCGWVWRDLKAANLLLDKNGSMLPIDFEGGARIGSIVTSPWGSPGHLPPEWLRVRRASCSQDRYALGVLIRHLFTSEMPSEDTSRALRLCREDVPIEVDHLVTQLTASSSRTRPSAEAAATTLDKVKL
jgi:tRNA A-37 threonylcarbamoyl transferase component Bud32